MSKKWTRSDNRNVAPSCVNSAGSSNYQVTDKGCDLSSADCPISAAGLTATSVSAGSTSRTCDQTANYTGSVIYSACTNGAPVTITTPCTPAAGCSAQSVTGSTTQTTAIAHGSSGSVTCDVAGYSGNTVNYTCSNGSLTPTPTCSCNSDYSGATCNSCALAGFDIAQNCTACLSNYDLVGGVCVRKCTTPAATGVNAGTLVPYSPVSQSCSASGYSGSYTYTCSAAGGTAAIISNTCVQQCAVTGMVGTLVTNVNPGTTSLSCNDTANHFTGTSTGAYSCSGGVFSLGTAACGCESGYSLVGGVCQQNCTLPNGTLGITDGTTVSSGATFQACNSGTYTGGITYTCTSGSVANITANSCSLPCTASVTPSSYNGKTVFTFLTSGTFSCPTAKNVEVLVVGGGGAGGSSSNEPSAGGGGGGGVVYASAYPIVANTTYNPVIGAGGISATVANAASVCVGRSGQNSTFGTITAIGGGGGGTGYGYPQPSCNGTKNPTNALSGGSGGGGANNNTTLAAPGSSTQTAQTNATNYYGNSGGSIPAACTVNSNNSRCGGAGGGGAGAAGSNATTVAGANGGAGKQIISISSNYYGGGGGGSRAYRDGSQTVGPNYGMVTIVNYSAGSGGIGGGGAGAVNGGSGVGTVGTPNTGGGGGSNASGGSGIVIIAY